MGNLLTFLCLYYGKREIVVILGNGYRNCRNRALIIVVVQSIGQSLINQATTLYRGYGNCRNRALIIVVVQFIGQSLINQATTLYRG